MLITLHFSCSTSKYDTRYQEFKVEQNGPPTGQKGGGSSSPSTTVVSGVYGQRSGSLPTASSSPRGFNRAKRTEKKVTISTSEPYKQPRLKGIRKSTLYSSRTARAYTIHTIRDHNFHFFLSLRVGPPSKVRKHTSFGRSGGTQSCQESALLPFGRPQFSSTSP